MPISMIVSLLLLMAPPAFAADGVSLGKKIFETNCLGCHRAGEDGRAGMAPVLTNPDFLAVASDKFLQDTIQKGRMNAGMPPWGWLGEKKISAVVAYLRSQSTRPNRGHAVDAQPAAKGDVGRGAALFASICVTCHGVKGEGYDSGNTGTHIGDAAFLQVASDGFIREVVKHGRQGTAMHGFSGPKAMAALTDKEIDDIIVYLRSLINQ